MTGKRGKNDAADAAAICEAMQRPNMRFVPIKRVDHGARLHGRAAAHAVDGHRRDHGHGDCCDGGQRQRVQVRAAVCGVDRAGTRAIQLWRKSATGADHQGRRRLPEKFAGDGCEGGAQRGQRQDRQFEPLGAGRWRCRSGEATGRRWWPSRPRTPAWPAPWAVLTRCLPCSTSCRGAWAWRRRSIWRCAEAAAAGRHGPRPPLFRAAGAAAPTSPLPPARRPAVPTGRARAPARPRSPSGRHRPARWHR